MTFQAIRNGYPIRAAATVGAITDLFAYVEEQKWEEKMLTSFWSDFSLNKKSILENRSVLSWYDDIDVPILLLHGAKDPQVKTRSRITSRTKIVYGGQNVSARYLFGWKSHSFRS